MKPELQHNIHRTFDDEVGVDQGFRIHFIHLIMQEYDTKCLKMYLITLKSI
jgi:hypothetical protein